MKTQHTPLGFFVVFPSCVNNSLPSSLVHTTVMSISLCLYFA
jgi:hypothetical protein